MRVPYTLAAGLGLVVALAVACGSDDAKSPGPEATTDAGNDARAPEGTGGKPGGRADGGETPDAAPPVGFDATTPVDGGADGGDAGGTMIGAAGGTVKGPGGSEAVVPAGALATAVGLGIAVDEAGAPALPDGFVAVGPILAFTPHGTAFAKPVTVRAPFDTALVPQGDTPVLLRAEPGGAFREVTSTVDAASLTASVNTFSWYVAARDAAHGGLRVVIDADDDVLATTAVTGPAGSVYVNGTTQADLDGAHPGGKSTCFVAKLTTLLAFEWVRQFPGCLGNPVVGPTGNLHVATYTADATPLLQLTSLNPSGVLRSGFPVTLGPTNIGGLYAQSLAVDGQDDVHILGYQDATTFDAAWRHNTRSWLASYTSSGQVKAARGQVTFETTVTEYDYPWDLVVNTAGLWIAADFQERPSGAFGYYLHRFDQSGAAQNFPLRVTNSAGIKSAPIALATLPATNDVIAIGTGRGSSQAPTLIRYHDTGVIAQGFPKDLVTGSTKKFTNNAADSSRRLATDGQGNAYFLTRLDEPADLNDAPEYVVLSYTSDGALRSGYPVHVGVDYTNQHPDAHYARGLAVAPDGTLYIAGYEASASVPTRQSLTIERIRAH